MYVHLFSLGVRKATQCEKLNSPHTKQELCAEWDCVLSWAAHVTIK